MHMTALAAASVLCALAQDRPQDEALPTRRAIDLTTLRRALEPATHWSVFWSPLAEPERTPGDFMDGPLLAHGCESSGDVTELLARDLEKLASALASDPADVSVFSLEPVATVVADDAGMARLARAMALVEAWATRRWTVELLELPPEAARGLDAALLTAAETDALLAVYPARGAESRLVTPRRPARFEALRLAPFVADVDVDTGTVTGLVADPRVGVARWGRDTLVEVRSRSRNSTFVDVRTWGGEPTGPPRLQRPYPAHPVELELPRGSLFKGVGSGVVPDGGALVLSPSGSDGGVTLVRVRRIEGLAGELTGNPEVLTLGLGGWPGTRGMWAAHRLAGPAPSGGEEVTFDALYGYESGEREGPALSARDVDEDLLAVRDRWLELGLRGAVTRLGCEVLAIGEQPALALLHDHVRAPLERGERTFTFDLRFGAVPRDVARGLAVGAEVRAERLAPALEALADDTRLLGAAAADAGVLWTAGHEARFVHDLDVELSMGGASLPDPIVATLTTGFSAACRAVPMHGDALLVSFELRRRALVSMRSADVTLTAAPPGGGTPVGAWIDLPTTEGRDVAATLSLRPGAWTVIALESPHGAPEGAAELALLRVTEMPRVW